MHFQITCGAIILAICVFEIFALPIYLYKDNIPAISILLLLYGYLKYFVKIIYMNIFHY